MISLFIKTEIIYQIFNKTGPTGVGFLTAAPAGAVAAPRSCFLLQYLTSSKYLQQGLETALASFVLFKEKK